MPYTFLMRIFVAVHIFLAVFVSAAHANDDAYVKALFDEIRKDKSVLSFYKDREYAPIWVGNSSLDRNRQWALIAGYKTAFSHGLPADLFNAAELQRNIRTARTAAEKGALEGRISIDFVRFARALQTGILTPRKVDSDIVRKVPLRDRKKLLEAFSQSTPAAFIQQLHPQTIEYSNLFNEKARLERSLARNGVPAQLEVRTLRPGDTGQGVASLRDRLVALGFMARSNSQIYDEEIIKAVKLFQLEKGLVTDGVAGPITLTELNTGPVQHLAKVIVAMERERWNNGVKTDSFVRVNIPEYTAKIILKGQTVFETRAVVGSNVSNQRSPEFSDVMEFMVINPSWYVPRSITVNEYLPMLQLDPKAVDYFEIRDDTGTAVSRDTIDFASFTPEDFPYSLRQPPSRGNALGLVKFMFPNRHNIYLHDTPHKSLFGRQQRAFSHGCIRLAEPFEFAHVLLAQQTTNPEAFFEEKLSLPNESQVNLAAPLPVHLVYRTAFTAPDGNITYRPDVYGRDAKIWSALHKTGVVLAAVNG